MARDMFFSHFFEQLLKLRHVVFDEIHIFRVADTAFGDKERALCPFEAISKQRRGETVVRSRAIIRPMMRIAKLHFKLMLSIWTPFVVSGPLRAVCATMRALPNMTQVLIKVDRKKIHLSKQANFGNDDSVHLVHS